MILSHSSLVNVHIFAFVLASIWNSSLGESACRGLRNEFLAQNTEVARFTDAMWNNYADTCEEDGNCSLEITPASAVTHLNYAPLKDSVHYDKIRTVCNNLGSNDNPTTLCHVNSEMVVSNDATGSKLITDKFIIRREPVCFAYQCQTAQAALAHPYPLGCDPERTTCTVSETHAECGNRPEGAGVGNCKLYSDKISKDEDLIDAYTELYSDVGVECFDYKSDGHNEVCTTISEPVGLSLTKKLRPFKTSNIFKSFENACFNADGEVCYMSLNAQIEGEIVAFNFDLAVDINEYPMCFPRTCSGDGMLYQARDAIGKDISRVINDQMRKNRRLKNVFPPELDRLLQDNEESEWCPVGGMDKCNIVVVDFYCKKGSGEETVKNVATGSSTTTTITSSAFKDRNMFYKLLVPLAGLVLSF